jgi:phenylacetate-CoA ligase
MTAGEHPRYWNAEVETLSRDGLRQLQERKLADAVRRAQACGFYRRKFAEAGAAPADIRTLDDLARLPLTTKDDLRRSQSEHPPYGDYLAVPKTSVLGIYASSGSTGEPTTALATAEDHAAWAERGARFFWAFGVRPHDIAQNMYNFQLFAGAWAVHLGMQRVGCAVITMGVGNSERQLQVMQRYGTTFTGMTPSYAFHLAAVAQQMGIDIRRDLRLKRMIVSGEPGASAPAVREKIEALWGAKVYDWPGMQEALGWSGSCEAQTGTHVAEDHFILEVLDPETRRAVGPGETGVAVLTQLENHAQPLLRWWTDDYVVYSTDYCPCGRTARRLPFGILGRADDMLKISGVRVWPSGIEATLKELPGFGGEFRIVKDRTTVQENSGALVKLKLRVECGDAVDREPFAAAVAARVKAKFNVTPIVELVGERSLARFEHKTKRVVDERQ